MKILNTVIPLTNNRIVALERLAANDPGDERGPTYVLLAKFSPYILLFNFAPMKPHISLDICPS